WTSRARWPPTWWPPTSTAMGCWTSPSPSAAACTSSWAPAERGAPMRYGFYLPTRGETATPDAIETLVARGGALGFSSVMIAGHIAFPAVVTSKYPSPVSGVFPGGGDALEQLTLMSFVAARTSRLRLVTSVMILPYRNPVATAKMLATV